MHALTISHDFLTILDRYIVPFRALTVPFLSFKRAYSRKLTISHDSRFVLILDTIIAYYIACYSHVSFGVWGLKRYINRMFIATFLWGLGPQKVHQQDVYSNVPFEVPGYIMRILHGRSFLIHFLRIFMRTFFLSPWTSRVYIYIYTTSRHRICMCIYIYDITTSYMYVCMYIYIYICYSNPSLAYI